MPQTRNYTVTQTREVKVVANDPVSAARIAELAFAGTETMTSKTAEDELGIWGYTTGKPVVSDIHSKEETYL